MSSFIGILASLLSVLPAFTDGFLVPIKLASLDFSAVARFDPSPTTSASHPSSVNVNWRRRSCESSSPSRSRVAQLTMVRFFFAGCMPLNVCYPHLSQSCVMPIYQVANILHYVLSKSTDRNMRITMKCCTWILFDHTVLFNLDTHLALRSLICSIIERVCRRKGDSSLATGESRLV